MKKILLPTDFSEASLNALNFAAIISKKFNAELVLLNVFHIPMIDINMPADVVSEITQTEEKKATENIKKLCHEVIKKHDIKCNYLVKFGFVVDELLSFSESQDTDMIVMGTTGADTFVEKIIGSNTSKVIEKAKCPVLAVPENAVFKDFRKIIYASDFEGDDTSIIEDLLKFSKPFKGNVCILNVIDVDSSDAEIEENFRERIMNHFPGEQINVEFVENSDVVEGIDKFIHSEGADLLAVTKHSRTFFENLFHSSITAKIAFHTDIPLLAYHEREI